MSQQVIDAEYDPKNQELRLGINMDRIWIPAGNELFAKEIVRFLRAAGCIVEWSKKKGSKR